MSSSVSSRDSVDSKTSGTSPKYSDSISEKYNVDDAEVPVLSKQHPFLEPRTAEYWSGIYEQAEYECRHKFDPSFTWTKGEEKKLLRKLDFYIMGWVWIMFFSLDLVRQNLHRALAGTFLEDLNINQNDVNNGQIIFYLCFLSMELPSGLISKKVGAPVWVPVQIVGWSIVGVCQAALRNRAGFFITRALLGICMGGFIPDIILYLSFFYTSAELNVRMSWFYTVLGVSQIVSSLLATGFLRLQGLHGVAGWSYLFAFDGLISGVIGIFAFFLLPSSATQTAGLLRGKKGWFTDREESILVNRILRDDPSKGDMNNRTGVSLSGILACLKEFDLWPVYIIAFFSMIAYQPPTTFLSYILRLMGKSTFESNMLAIPSQALFAINTVWYAWLSTRLREKSLMTSLSCIWVLVCLIAIVVLPKEFTSHLNWSRYAILTLITGYPFPLAFLVGWVSQNSFSVRNRTVSLCLLNMSVQVGSIMATRFYTDGEKPFYQNGNIALIAVSAFSILLCILAKLYYIHRNNQKKKIWDRMTPEQQVEYTTTTTSTGPRRLDVMFIH
ncbi:hypothetical protein MCUN1_001685 [Malassezia cuniculi]|uniref:MFS general substrate transporter n=1 Tax=Malassezia cuniculi TaxID=948313 RepID=A0AAF0EV04_9BASI|nr:hypothetical protein MCUN1_001685 [Malassezia cuniculi]